MRASLLFLVLSVVQSFLATYTTLTSEPLDLVRIALSMASAILLALWAILFELLAKARP